MSLYLNQFPETEYTPYIPHKYTIYTQLTLKPHQEHPIQFAISVHTNCK